MNKKLSTPEYHKSGLVYSCMLPKLLVNGYRYFGKFNVTSPIQWIALSTFRQLIPSLSDISLFLSGLIPVVSL